MSITQKTRQTLWGRSGNRCAFPGCRKVLVEEKDQFGNTLNHGNICHIESKKREGPRYNANYLGDPDDYDNLILMCAFHHTEIDTRKEEYTVEKLKDIRRNHEIWVETQLDSSQTDKIVFRLWPSFKKISIPVLSNRSADKFYNGFKVQMEDIKADFDFRRTVYLSKGGINDHIKNILSNSDDFIEFIIIKGVGGTGKSTLIHRISFDLVTQNKNVFLLNEDWLESADVYSIQSQIKNIISSYRDAIIIIDNFVDCIDKEHFNFDGFRDEVQGHRTIFIIIDQPDRFNSIDSQLRNLNNFNSQEFILRRLELEECEFLADKMISLEESGSLKVLHNNLSRAQRINICIENARRHLVVVMLEMRYGKRFVDIVISEYEKIPSKIAQEAYLIVCFCNNFNLFIPEQLLIATFNHASLSDLRDFRSHTEEIIIDDRRGLCSRHEVISREVFNCFTNKLVAQQILIKILSPIQSHVDEKFHFYVEFVTTRDIHNTIFNLLEGDKVSLGKLMNLVKLIEQQSPKDIKKQSLCFRAEIELLCENKDSAIMLFQEVISIDESYSYAYRQIAWIEHYRYNYDNAAKYAIESHGHSTDPKHTLQVAKLLSLNKIKYFRLAKRYFEEIANENPDDEYYRKVLNNYLEAEQVLSHFLQMSSDHFIPDEVIQSLRPGIKFFKNYFGSESHQFESKLKGVLQYMEGNTVGNIDDLEELVSGYDVDKNRIISSKYYSNLGRMVYLQWYKSESVSDPVEALELLKMSLKLNNNDPFTHCWLGTYYKSVEMDFELAENEYRTAIQLAEQSRHHFEKNHPIFCNNLGLLLMDAVIENKKPREELYEAERLFNTAIEVKQHLNVDFYWPEENLSFCSYLIRRFL